ncbi:type VI secretion system baseplate subunit TssG [Mucilaginibacter sp. 21P]|uniref:type VI secretion system baseplate subunit TssG n=1 Tax=Mucilaginibacter sp. 21P TaxID=2778902 RepID=UPI001C58BC18|nr:type VI secretion system baseplate subunit TssG [Mucilaginibacter sp. 21P]QXV65595.1 type VI secretion system baseplate subunit TssG [Mucilaginibacter sp. 21P]
MPRRSANRFNTDFKAVTLAAELIEQGEVDADKLIILPVGPQERAYAKEVRELTTYRSAFRDREMTLIRINREGLYDMLPEGLFHAAPQPSESMDEEGMIKDISNRREEEKHARAFFAPFEAELYQIRTIVELYESRLDKKSDYDELVNIFLTEWREFDCFDNKQMIMLMHVLPVIHEQRNNLSFIGNVLGIMFQRPFNLQYRIREATASQEAMALQTKLGQGVLGVNFIAGFVQEPEEDLSITVGPLTAKQMLDFLPGTRSARALEVLLSYFIPLQTGYVTHYLAGPEAQKLSLGADQENSCLGVTTYLGVN